jgi:hypothetical protein
MSIAANCLLSSHSNALAIGIRVTEADGAEAIVVANAAAALAVACTGLIGPEALCVSCFGTVRQSEAGQRHAGEADAEFLHRRAARDRLGQVLGEFIEFVVHTFPFGCLHFLLICGTRIAQRSAHDYCCRTR